MPDAELIGYIYGNTPETLMDKFTERDAGFFLARIDENIAGCAGYSKSDDGIAELQNMYVSPEARGKGVARGLITACLDAIRNDKRYGRGGLPSQNRSLSDLATISHGRYSNI